MRTLSYFLTSLLCFACQLANAAELEVVVVKIGCFTGSPEQLEILKKSRQGKRGCRQTCSGCGCRGGPGYRDKNGSCVSYINLISICGKDYSNCKKECADTELICISPTNVSNDATKNSAVGSPACDRSEEPTVRGPNGECVKQNEVRRVCGAPPTSRCTIELPSLK